jgi:uncharacterized protein YdhG (YjbR/CyaY superfamily)
MNRGSAAPTTIDEYIAAFPPDVRKVLQDVRTTIRKAAPDAAEAMKYGIPTFVQGENLVHFGGFKTHVGFYPTPSGIAAFERELAAYEGAKGSVQFPLDKRLPLPLIARIVKFRVKEVEQKAAQKKAAKKTVTKAVKKA